MKNDDLVVPGVFIQDNLAAPSVRAPQEFSHALLAPIVRLGSSIDAGCIAKVEPCYCQRVVVDTLQEVQL